VNVVLIAEESAGVQVLKRLAEGANRIVAVLTRDDAAVRGATVASVARNVGAHVIDSKRVRDPQFASWLKEESVDIILNIHSLYVVHAYVVAAPKIGSFNLHPGPLPEYAGLNAPSWAIYHGERNHGVTIHWMDPGIDTGAIAYEARFPISDDDTGLSLSAKCVRNALPLVDELLQAATNGAAAIPAVPQQLDAWRYYGREIPQGGRLEWARPARDVVNFVRAADYTPFESPWGHPRTWLNGAEVEVVKAARTGDRANVEPGTVGGPDGDGARVAAADEWVLIRRIRADGKTHKASDRLHAGQTLGDLPHANKAS
jgi:UDP-4-amino-4-deoxy-L-arabinose formyltransferase/UDP-glucuronic acid dehydrogenase (UDP-4-keto-hexauronic acid decarboxylating)